MQSVFERPISELEIRQIKKIKYSKLFPCSIISILGLLAGLVVNISYNSAPIYFLTVVALSLVICIITFLLITKRYDKDIKSGLIKIEESIVQKTDFLIDYEAGSGSEAPNTWSTGREMKEIRKYSVYVKDEHFLVSKEDYPNYKVGEIAFIKKTYISDIVLGLEYKR